MLRKVSDFEVVLKGLRPLFQISKLLIILFLYYESQSKTERHYIKVGDFAELELLTFLIVIIPLSQPTFSI